MRIEFFLCSMKFFNCCQKSFTCDIFKKLSLIWTFWLLYGYKSWRFFARINFRWIGSFLNMKEMAKIPKTWVYSTTFCKLVKEWFFFSRGLKIKSCKVVSSFIRYSEPILFSRFFCCILILLKCELWATVCFSELNQKII